MIYHSRSMDSTRSNRYINIKKTHQFANISFNEYTRIENWFIPISTMFDYCRYIDHPTSILEFIECIEAGSSLCERLPECHEVGEENDALAPRGSQENGGPLDTIAFILIGLQWF